MRRLRLWWWATAVGIVAACVGLAVACGGGSSQPKPHAQIKTNFHAPPDVPPSGIHKIRHVVIIMQENRSFDSYFGTYPGADGIPGLAGNPGPLPCVPTSSAGRHHHHRHRHKHTFKARPSAGCLRPFHDRRDLNVGGPHSSAAGFNDITAG